MSQYLSSILCNVSGTYRVFKDKIFEYMTKEYEHKPVKRMFPDYTTLEQTKTFFGYPHHIIDDIYLGSSFNAANYNHLLEINEFNKYKFLNDLKNVRFSGNISLTEKYENEIFVKHWSIKKEYSDFTYEKCERGITNIHFTIKY